jgi:hypothetical protein
MELDVETAVDVDIRIPRPPAVPREAATTPPPLPEPAPVHAVPKDERAWPEPDASDDDPYLTQLRKSGTLVPPSFARVLSDVKWSVSPTGRSAAKEELRKMTALGLGALVLCVRSFADAVEERVPR